MVIVGYEIIKHTVEPNNIWRYLVEINLTDEDPVDFFPIYMHRIWFYDDENYEYNLATLCDEIRDRYIIEKQEAIDARNIV